MIAELFRALVFAGLPVGVASFLLVWWALRSQYLERSSDLKQIERQVTELSKAKKKRKKATGKDGRSDEVRLNPVHNKWLKFGGGFYGVVALVTFVMVEIAEVGDFLGQFSDNVSRLAQLNLDVIIRFIIDSFMNFITAIAWPVYWMAQIDSDHIWVWFVAAYAGYWAGAKMAIRFRDGDGAMP